MLLVLRQQVQAEGKKGGNMTKLEVACVVCGLIGVLIFQPYSWKIINGNKADIMLIVFKILQMISFLAMILLPLYFRLWRK